MTDPFWKSLRSRILLLAILTFLFLAGAAFSFFSFLRSSHTATLAAAERHLVAVASGLARSYAERPATVPSLSVVQSQPGPLPPGPEPGLGPEPGAGPPPPPPLQRSSEDRLFASLTSHVLRQEAGIEGGFYAAGNDTLLGYAFPTHEGPGPSKEMPQRERPTIENLVRSAAASGSSKISRFEGPHDAVLFVAVPARDVVAGQQEKVTGAVWLMQRMPGVTRGRNRELLWGSIGFASAAIITALLTFFVTGEVSRDVNAVLARLGALENGFSAQTLSQSPGAHLQEFDRVLRGVDSLASSLQQKIEKERRLEAEMRHQERLSALGQFAAGIAHELRNPLATIRLRTQMSERSVDPGSVARNSKVILEEIDRLDGIIGRLLYFSRPIHLRLEPVVLDDLCLATAKLWSDRPECRDIAVRCRPASSLMVECDRGRLQQVLDNLLDNAVHAASSRAGGEVWLSTHSDDEFARIEIRDNGAGLTTDVMHHAMDPFFTTKESGTGLGLSISFEIVQAHGGELTLRNDPQGGVVASVRLPLHSAVSPHGEFTPEKLEPRHG